MSEKKRSRIAVLGSLNLDVVIQCAHLPSPGETIIAESSREVSGGKGANQAVAAARLGAEVYMIGRTGNDEAGAGLLNNLQAESIHTEAVFRSDEVGSGLAVVMVEQSGENSIVVVPGANGIVSEKDVDAAAAIIDQSDLLLVQLEIPLETVLYACDIARKSGTRIILDPAPAPCDVVEDFYRIDLICPNQSEAAALLGRPVETVSQAEAASKELVERGASNAIITLGKQGAVLCDGSQTVVIPPCPVETVDSTAAGDAFAAAVAVCWSEQNDLLEATKFACASGALAASRPGAQPAMPTRKEVEELIEAKSRTDN